MTRERRAPACAVIGAGYGDEGKGLLTDAVSTAFGSGTVVIRHNGGAQAGHTVTLEDGRSHVFHHVGSGVFSGAATFLSRHFVSNSIVLTDELQTLANFGVIPRIAADERGWFTTPWDMMINQFVEEARGKARHGSCGLGFGETIERCQNPAYATPLALLRGDLGALRDRFDRIRREWLPARLTRLGHPDLWLRHRHLILSETGLERAVASSLDLLEKLDLVASPASAVPVDAPIVFEGAQGLMLDQIRGAFPYVTRSNTGLANIAEMAAELGLERVEAIYATRVYVTRHGAGPLTHEQPEPPSPSFRDATNRPNPWQGRLRFGRLDLDILAEAIRADLASVAGTGLDVAARLAVTCLDQLEGAGANWIAQGRANQGSGAELVRQVGSLLPGSPPVIESHGPTRATIRAMAFHPTG